MTRITIAGTVMNCTFLSATQWFLRLVVSVISPSLLGDSKLGSEAKQLKQYKSIIFGINSAGESSSSSLSTTGVDDSLLFSCA